MLCKGPALQTPIFTCVSRVPLKHNGATHANNIMSVGLWLHFTTPSAADLEDPAALSHSYRRSLVPDKLFMEPQPQVSCLNDPSFL